MASTKSLLSTAFTPTTVTTPNVTVNLASLLKKSKKYSVWKSTMASFWNAAFTSVKITSSLEAILILSTNILLFLLIVTSPQLRARLRNQLVMSLVVANMFVGLLSAPFSVDVTVRKAWVHGCYLFVVITLLSNYVQNLVATWGVALLLLHYAARLRGTEIPPAGLSRLPFYLQRAAPYLYVCLPWLVALLVSVPLVFAGIRQRIWALWNDARCPIALEAWASILLNVLAFFGPALVLLVLTVIIVVLARRRSWGQGAGRGGQGHGTEMGATLVSEDKEELEGCWVHVATAVQVLLMMGPEHVFLAARIGLRAPWQSVVIASVFVNLLSDLLPFTLALTWLLMLPDVRGRLAELLSRWMPQRCCQLLPSCCRTAGPPQSSGSTSIAPVAFRELEDE